MTRDSRSPPPPSWPKVIATTLRLWLQRHVLPARLKPGHRWLMVAVLVIIVAGGGMTAEAVVLSNHGSASTPPGGQAPLTPTSPLAHSRAPAASASLPPSAELAAATATRSQAAAWVAAQVSRGVVVACDPLMCTALEQRGFPAADLAAITVSAGDSLGASIVVSTPTVRSQLGPRLATVYAPVVIASFGSGASLVQVRESPGTPAASYLAALRRDRRERKAAGRQLARNSRIVTPPGARAELEAGQVDSRLLITLAALAHRFPVHVRSFGDGGPGVADTVPLRQVIVTAPSARYLSRLLAFVRAQRSPLRAAVVQHRHGGITVVQIQFSAPSPIGLLGSSASP